MKQFVTGFIRGQSSLKLKGNDMKETVMRHAAEATLKESVGPGKWVLHTSRHFESVGGDYLGGLVEGDTVYAVYVHDMRVSEHRIIYVFDGVGFFIDHDEEEFLPRLKVATLGFYKTRQEAIAANREMLDEYVGHKVESAAWATEEIARVRALLAE